jgi:dipeptidyl aminopeptidase/acylaminoacyl peptidase
MDMDDRVAAAVSHWGPRFTTNGVTVADFERVTAGVERWEDWCAAWVAVAEPLEQLGREALREGRLRSAGAHLAQAAVYYHFAKYLFVDDLDQMRAAHERAVACLTDALPHLDPPGRRIEIPFDGARMVGVLRVPAGPGPHPEAYAEPRHMKAHPQAGAPDGGDLNKHPCVVLVPGLDSAKEEFRSTEALFLERGLATFSVDGPGQGEAEYDLPIRGDWEVPGAAILDRLLQETDLDAGRVGVWGVSLGGYYAPRWAAGDDRVRACVALAGPYDFGDCWDQLPALTRAAFRVRSRSASDEEAKARAHELSLAGRTAAIKAPLLVVTGKLDRLIPWEHAQRLADEAGGPADLLLLENGNHGCMNVWPFHRYRTADWMASALSARVVQTIAAPRRGTAT